MFEIAERRRILKENNKTVIDPPTENIMIQKAIHNFISANILHRKAIESWSSSAGMHSSQHRMLLYLSKCEHIPSQKDLARHFDISPPAVAATLKKLEADGYIERGKCGERTDSRFNEIRITEQGRTACIQSRKYFRHIDCEAFKGFSPEEIELFNSFLERMAENMKTVEPLPEGSDDGK